jgi:hypothetical protein
MHDTNCGGTLEWLKAYEWPGSLRINKHQFNSA